MTAENFPALGEKMVADGEQHKTRGPAIKLVPFNQITLTTALRYLVKGLLPAVGVCMVWGPYSCGKSFFIIDLLLRVALGWEYRGRRVQRGPVVYFAFEGAFGLEARAVAFRQEFINDMDEADIPFYLCTLQLDLVRDHRKLIDKIRITLGGANPVAVCLDTLNRSLAGSESSDEDMGNYFKACDAIREAFNCAVIVVHHCGYDDKHSRGHTSFCCNAEAEIAIKKDAADNVVATVKKMKDGPAGETVTSRLEQVEVGEDEDGEPITSCVVLEAEPLAKDARGGPRLSPNQGTMLTILKDAMPDGLTQAVWYEKAREAGIGTSRKATLTDCSLALKDKHLVYEFDGVWKLTHKG